MSQVEREFQEYDEGRLWNEVYRRFKNEATPSSLDEKYSVLHARSPHNRHKNRYRDVSPYDHSRVVLERGEDDDNDYINASFVEVPQAGRKYILTQGPLEHTCGDFWLMVWQQKSKAVVMLNRVIEKGTIKCAQYWPLGVDSGEDDDMVLEEVGLRVTVKGEQDCNNFIIRWLQLTHMETGEQREVLHFHYVTWPDFGVPTSPTAFLQFLRVVREGGVLQRSVGPAIVHCSAGIGRSGTFCLVDSCLVLVEKEKSLDCVDLRGVLKDMRSYRMGLIQTPDQLRFSYLAVIQGARVLLGHDANSNIKIPDEEESPQQHRGSGREDDAPPPPPTRVTSLPEYQRSPSPVEPSSDDDDDDQGCEENGQEENIDDELAALIDDDDEAPPDLPPKKGQMSGFERMASREEEQEEESMYKLRRRIREERQKETKKRLMDLKDRQRKSAVWGRRSRSYLQPICLGLALLVGSYMVYRLYFRK